MGALDEKYREFELHLEQEADGWIVEIHPPPIKTACFADRKEAVAEARKLIDADILN